MECDTYKSVHEEAQVHVCSCHVLCIHVMYLAFIAVMSCKAVVIVLFISIIH